MESAGSDWYQKIWTLGIKNQSWVEETKTQVDFLIRALSLKGNERILDLACGYGRHSLELARRGFSVVGVDITRDYILDATHRAEEEHSDAKFILSDLRDISFDHEFDVVLNMGDGAVGYLEDEAENNKIFDIIGNALNRSGKHFMDIMSADYAEKHFPCQTWAAGENGLTLSRFEWNKDTKTMFYGQIETPYGAVLQKPIFTKGNPTRLYSLDEIKTVMLERGLRVVNAFSDFQGAPADDSKMQMLIYSCRI